MIDHFHPLLIHFPIVLLPLATLFQLCNLILPEKTEKNTALILLLLGSISSLTASLLGGKARTLMINQNSETIEGLLNQHELYANITTWGSTLLFIAWVYFRLKYNHVPQMEITILVILTVLSLAVFYTGHIRGELVYKYSVGIR